MNRKTADRRRQKKLRRQRRKDKVARHKRAHPPQIVALGEGGCSACKGDLLAANLLESHRVFERFGKRANRQVPFGPLQVVMSSDDYIALICDACGEPHIGRTVQTAEGLMLHVFDVSQIPQLAEAEAEAAASAPTMGTTATRAAAQTAALEAAPSKDLTDDP